MTPLTLVTDVHENFLRADFDDVTFDDIASSKGQGARLLHGLFHCQHKQLRLTFHEPMGGLVSAGPSETPLPNGPDVATATEVEG